MFRSYLINTITYDGRSLAIFRILLGVMVMADLLDRAAYFELMYTNQGLTPISELRETYGRSVIGFQHFCLHMLHESTGFQVALFLLAGLCALPIILGWRTRTFVILAWILHTSVVTRNPVYVYASDVVLNLLLFWGIFLPLAATFSLDRRRCGKRAVQDPALTLVGNTCFLVQVCMIYVCAGFAKGSWWYEGTALLHAMHYDMVITPIGKFLGQFPTFLKGLTWFVLAVEFFGTGLLFVPFLRAWARGLCVILFMGFHLSIAFTLNIGFFPWVSLVLWVPFIPTGFWNFLRIGKGDPLEGHLSGSPAEWITSGRRPAVLLPALLAAGTLFLVILTTAPLVKRISKVGVLEPITHSYLSFTKLKQKWSVFSNQSLLSRDGWFSIQGTLADGREVDILRGLVPVDYDRPTLTGSKRRLSLVWVSYLTSQERGEGENLDHLAAFLHRKQKEADGKGFTHIRMVFLHEPVMEVEGQAPERVVFWEGPPP